MLGSRLHSICIRIALILSVLVNKSRISVCRRTGKAHFRRKLLSRAGIIVDVPHHMPQQSTVQQAEYLKTKIQAATGISLSAHYQ